MKAVLFSIGRNRRTLALSVATMVLGCSSLLVTPSASAGGWSGAARVLEIYPSPGSQGIYIKYESMPNPDNCNSPSYFFLPKSNALFNQTLALLMAAPARQSPINLQLVGCGGPSVNYPEITQIIAH